MRTGGVTGVDLNNGIFKTNSPIYNKITRLNNNEVSGYFMLNTGYFWLGYKHHSSTLQNHSEKSAVTCFKMGDNFLETQRGTVDTTYSGNRYMMTLGRDFATGFSTFMQL